MSLSARCVLSACLLREVEDFTASSTPSLPGSGLENSFILANPSLPPPCILLGATIGLTISRTAIPAASGAISAPTALLLPNPLKADLPFLGAVSFACAALPDLALFIKLWPLLTPPPPPAPAIIPNLLPPDLAFFAINGLSLTTSFFASFSALCWSYLSLILFAASTLACSISPLVRKYSLLQLFGSFGSGVSLVEGSYFLRSSIKSRRQFRFQISSVCSRRCGEASSKVMSCSMRHSSRMGLALR